MRIVKNCITKPDKFKRYRKFEKFINTRLNVTKVYRNGKEIRQDKHLKYDVLIAGSDQIWHPNCFIMADGGFDFYFLNFNNHVKKKIFSFLRGRKWHT